MKSKKILIGILFFLLVSSYSFARERKNRNFGLGVVIGAPTGFTGKLWYNKTNAMQVNLAWAFSSDFQMNVDYLWHRDGIFKVPEGRMPLYFGPGLRAQFGRYGTTLGISGVIGFEYIFQKEPFEIFLELSPAVLIVPATTAVLDGGFGFRYYF